MTRKAVPKKTRFEVFKRDAFTCQYCGCKAPDVVLHCDHVHPVAEGGTNDLMNLITACEDCNGGKGARLLDDAQVVAKARAQMEEINERRIQLEMLASWHRELSALGNMSVQVLEDFWRETLEADYAFSKHGQSIVKKWLKRFSEDELLTAISESVGSYVKRGADGAPTQESVEKAFDFIPRVAAMRRKQAENPHLKQVYYIRGILRNRLSYLNETAAVNLMDEAVAHGIDLDAVEDMAKTVRSWSAFRRALEDFIIEQGSD